MYTIRIGDTVNIRRRVRLSPPRPIQIQDENLNTLTERCTPVTITNYEDVDSFNRDPERFAERMCAMLDERDRCAEIASTFYNWGSEGCQTGCGALEIAAKIRQA